ncbi:MAG: PKD domain-containing protein [Bacteroidia bacterium]
MKKIKKTTQKQHINKLLLVVVCLVLVGISYLKASTPIMLLRLEVSGQSMNNETVVYFDSTGSFTYNSLTDAPSLGVSPGYLNIVTRFDSIDYQIKCLPLLVQNISIPVKVVTGSSGTYQIYGSDIQNLPSGACIMLHDNLTNTNQDLRLGAYTCIISDTESVARFVLNISVSTISVSGSFANPTCSLSGNGSIIASPPVSSGATLWNYYWKDSMNNIIKTSLLKKTSDTLNGINKGAYRVDINTNGTCTNGTLIYYLQGSLSPVALFTTPSDTVSMNVSFTNESTNASNYLWDFGDGTGATDTNTSYSYANPGTYIVTLTAIGSVCADTSIYSKAITVTGETTAIKQTKGENSNMFINRDASGYYVQFNYNSKTDAIISVSDLLGQSVSNTTKVGGVTNEKIYINTSNDENRVLIILVVSNVGEKIYKKIIN